MNDDTVRAYLLGTLAEPEAQRLEERMLDDDELFQLLRSVEADLIDDFARGNLDEEARRAFQKRYVAQGPRVTFARALAKRSTNVVPIRRPALSRGAWIGFAVAATLIVVLGTLLVRRVEPKHDPRPILVAKRRVRMPRDFSVVLVLATARSAGGASVITIPADAERIQLHIRLDPEDRFERYSAVMSSAAGEVWRGESLKASSEGDGLTLVADVPSSAVPNGSYELAVRGDLEALGFITLEVHR